MNLLSERQEIFRGMVEVKIRMQGRAMEKYYEQIIEEIKELKRNQKRLCYLCRASSIYGDITSKEMRSGSSRRMKKEQDLLSLLSVMQVIGGG